LWHIADGFKHFKSTDPALEAAWLFHDCYYDPLLPAGSNERISAHQAGYYLNDQIGLIEDLILSTADFFGKHSTLFAEIHDADFSGFALLDPFVVDGQLREENRHLTVTDWKNGRKKFLTKLLEQDQIYFLHPEWEEPARGNIKRLLYVTY
jgi:predicted metal-dependent HD superfamily phosphohydrolase